MSYGRPNDPYIHSNASQYDDRYQQGSYRDDPTGQYKDEGNAATQAAQTYSYSTPKKGLSKWIKIGVPIAILVIVGAVVGGVVGSRNSDNSSSSNNKQEAASNVDPQTSSAAAAAAKAGGGNDLFYQGTDVYGNPSFKTSGLTFDAPTMNGEEVGNCGSDPWTPSNSTQNLRPNHPLLFAPQYQWNCLAAKISKDAYLTAWNDTIFKNASAFYDMSPTNYSIDGGYTGSGILDVSREVQLRVKTWAYAYRVSNDTKWVDRTWTELQTAAGNTSQFFGRGNGLNWNPDHFLDVGEMTLAFAYAYDWLYDVLGQQRREAVMWSIINLGLQQGMTQYNTAAGWWKNTNGNWNCVCNGGLLLGALAIKNEDPTGIADQIISNAISNMKGNCMTAVYEDGTWTETPNYWYFGTNAQARAVSGLITATGSDQGMMAVNPDFTKTGLFHMYVSGNAGMFAYGDNGPNKYSTNANGMFLYSRLENNPLYGLFQRDRADAADPLSMFWYDTSSKGAFWNGLALDYYFNQTSNAWASMRSSWTDFTGTYVAIKASNNTGHQTHGDLDVGDFVIDALGTRWAGEFGSANYLSTDYFTSEADDAVRWEYYRKGTQGQNTLVIGNKNQLASSSPNNQFATTGVKQTSDVNFKPATNDVAYFITDMSAAYNLSSGTVQRGIRMLNGRRQVLVQDEVGSQPDSIEWRVHTNGSVTLSSDNRTATLKIQKIQDPNAGFDVSTSLAKEETMIVKILQPSGATFELTTPDVREYGSDPNTAAGEQGDQPNPGVTAMSIRLNGGSAQTIQVVWQPQWPDLSTADSTDPKSVALSGWSLTSHN